MRYLIATLMLGMSTAAAAKNVDLGPNVTLRAATPRGEYVDTVSQQLRGATFAQVKMCLAELITNPPVTITGGTDAPFTFQSSGRTTTNTAGGGDVFKYEDPEAATVIATGLVDAGTLVMSREVVRFDVKAIAGPDGTTLRWANITRATLDTGTVTNNGFSPVGAWRGARPQKVVDALLALGARIDSCLQ